MVDLAMLGVLERPVPYNVEAEKAVIGSLLIDRDAVIKIATFLKPPDFYNEAHGVVYEAILDLYARREPGDFVTLLNELQRKSRLEFIGGAPYLTDLPSDVPTSVHIEFYARIVEQLAIRRRLIATGGQIASLGYRQEQDVEQTLDEAEQLLFGVTQRQSARDFVPIGTVLDTVFDTINEREQHRGEVIGVPTGFVDIDEITGGLQSSDLVIVACRPSVGKCLKYDSLVDNPSTGERLTIQQYVLGHLPFVLGLSPAGQVRATEIAEWVDNGVKPCYRVTTLLGRHVEVTGSHPFLTANGWVPLLDLAVGQYVAVPQVVPVFGKRQLEAGLARLLAYYVAGGSLTEDAVRFANLNQQVVADLRSIIAANFPTCLVQSEAGTVLVGTATAGQAVNPLLLWLREAGLEVGNVEQQRFPACVWQFERATLADFLHGLLSRGGSLYQQGRQSVIAFASAAQGLAEDVQHALTRLGIVAKLSQETDHTWRVAITSTEGLASCQQQIGWPGAQAQVVSLQTVASRELVSTAAASGHGQTSHPALMRQAAGQAMVTSPDLYWDEIVAIEPIGEHQVYDLCVPDGANFIANDICVHNTSFCMSMAYNTAVRYGKRVGVFSLEMSKEQLALRLLAMETGVETHSIRNGYLTDDQRQALTRAFGDLALAPIYIDDTPGLSASELRSKARRLQASTGVDMIIVDYLQLMQGRRGSSGDSNRVQEVSEISRGLKLLARELNVPVVAAAQLSRGVESRQSHVPMLSDLRESGSIEQDADIVMFIYREEIYDPDTEKKGIAEIHIAKHRNGPTGIVRLLFQKETTKFVDLETHYGNEPGQGLANVCRIHEAPGQGGASLRPSRLLHRGAAHDHQYERGEGDAARLPAALAQARLPTRGQLPGVAG